MLPIKNNGNVINNKTWSDEVVTIRLGQTQRWNMPLPLGLFAYIKVKTYGSEKNGKRSFGKCGRRGEHHQYYELFYSCSCGTKR